MRRSPATQKIELGSIVRTVTASGVVVRTATVPIGCPLYVASVEAEILTLRHQLSVLRRKSSKRLAYSNFDRLVFARITPGVLNALVIVKPETVIRWHRAGFRLFWRWKSDVAAADRRCRSKFAN
jgi:hypothetical protein